MISQQEALLAKAMRESQRGNADAYRELLVSVRGILLLYVRRVLTRMGKRDAGAEEDLLQEVLLALHQKRHTYDSTQPFLPWLFAIARYKVIDYGRREKRRPTPVPLEKVAEALEAPVFSDPSAASDLESLVAGLPPKSRQLLQLVKIEGLSVAEAAARTQMSPSALKVAVHRAIKTLRSQQQRKEKVS